MGARAKCFDNMIALRLRRYLKKLSKTPCLALRQSRSRRSIFARQPPFDGLCPSAFVHEDSHRLIGVCNNQRGQRRAPPPRDACVAIADLVAGGRGKPHSFEQRCDGLVRGVDLCFVKGSIAAIYSG